MTTQYLPIAELIANDDANGLGTDRQLEGGEARVRQPTAIATEDDFAGRRRRLREYGRVS
jgi:hypothetical protein